MKKIISIYLLTIMFFILVITPVSGLTTLPPDEGGGGGGGGGGGYVCSSSTCAYTCCGNSCINTQTSTQNCDSCGHVCPSQQICQGGECVPPVVGCRASWMGVFSLGDNCSHYEDGNYVCNNGDSVILQLTYTGDACLQVRRVQADFWNNGNVCIINASGGSMTGMTFTSPSPFLLNSPYNSLTFNYNYTFQIIPGTCDNVNLLNVRTRLYDSSDVLISDRPDSLDYDFILNSTCGDNRPNAGEQCDNGTQNGIPCVPNYGSSCNYCSKNCEIITLTSTERCGDNLCNGETTASCFRDCEFAGWHTDDAGWNITTNDQLVFDSNNAIYLAGVIYSDTVDLRPGTYTLSATISSNDCTTYLDLNNGDCIDDGVAQNACFTNQQVPVNGGTAPSVVIAANNPYISTDGFLKGVKIRIRAEECADRSIIDNISLTEVPAAHIDFTPNIDAVSACCPQQWCWNGTTCVDSDLWMNNSNQSPVWNYVFTPEDRWFNEHVNTSYQNNANGYRCTNTTGTANWTAANIKYDWNFKSSGYCNLPTDCFVNDTKNYLDGRAGCIHNGEFVDDGFVNNQGNHYCNNGIWGTRTELMANFLASAAEGNSFILFCDTNNNTYNFVDEADMTKFAGIGGACTVVVKQGNEEQVITAFHTANIGGVLDAITKAYDAAGLQGDSESLVVGYLGSIEGWDPATYPTICQVTFPPDIIKCTIYDTGDHEAIHLRMYYNSTGNYFILSDKDVQVIDPSFWTTIRNFFWKLFGGNLPAEKFRFFNQTTNFNNVFILRNNSLSVWAVQESKYDELEGRLFNYDYITYNNTRVLETTQLNTAYLNTLYGENITYRNYGGASGYGTEIFIKSSRNIMLWPYLTSMLRDRSPPIN